MSVVHVFVTCYIYGIYIGYIYPMSDVNDVEFYFITAFIIVIHAKCLYLIRAVHQAKLFVKIYINFHTINRVMCTELALKKLCIMSHFIFNNDDAYVL